jgi:hypothetical protein
MFLSGIQILAFLFYLLGPLPTAKADELFLPKPGTMVTLSTAFSPPIITGMTIHPKNPLQFDFIVDTGDNHIKGEALKKESQKLINYFMATLTVPEDEMWVNLSPYEKNRIIADGLSKTEMGRDMLAQDYILKQLTASLIYPESRLGKEFWDRIYTKAQEQFGTTQIPTNIFNKVWIVPQDATVYVQDHNIFVTHSHLKVMLEEDYLSLNKHSGITALGNQSEDIKTQALGSQVVRALVLPALEKEVNEGKNFSNLRQIFNSMILAIWYKNKLKISLLNQIYFNKNKINGIDLTDKNVKEKIYRQYLKAYKKGVFNYIKEDMNPQTQDIMPRKYFSGGIVGPKAVREGILPIGWLATQERNPKVIINVREKLLQDSAMNTQAPWQSRNNIKTRSRKIRIDWSGNKDDQPKDVLEFSTKDANFLFHLGVHGIKTEIPDKVIESVDAVVLENGNVPIKTMNLEYILKDAQYQELAQKSIKYGKPIFYTDLPKNKLGEKLTNLWEKLTFSNIYVQTLLHPALIVPAFIPLIELICFHSFWTLPLILPFLSIFFYAIPNNTWQQIFNPIFVGFSNSYQASGFRSAVAANKISQDIIPEIAKLKGKKPTILIEYGNHHSDIKFYLQHSVIRDLVILLHRLLILSTRDGSYVNKIGEIRLDKGSQEVVVRPVKKLSDKALLASINKNSLESPGGIDLNPNNLNLKEQGQGGKLNFSFKNLYKIKPDNVNGVLPVITNISTVVDFSSLLKPTVATH